MKGGCLWFPCGRNVLEMGVGFRTSHMGHTRSAAGRTVATSIGHPRPGHQKIAQEGQSKQPSLNGYALPEIQYFDKR